MLIMTYKGSFPADVANSKRCRCNKEYNKCQPHQHKNSKLNSSATESPIILKNLGYNVCNCIGIRQH